MENTVQRSGRGVHFTYTTGRRSNTRRHRTVLEEDGGLILKFMAGDLEAPPARSVFGKDGPQIPIIVSMGLE